MTEPELLQKGLETFFANLGAPPLNVVTSLSERWVDIVGPALADVTEPLNLTDDVLVVSCSDPAFVAQVQWMETQIIEAFDAQFAPSRLKAVKAKLAR
jgi:predicted nucleic acid-binding Zn ribbon protein